MLTTGKIKRVRSLDGTVADDFSFCLFFFWVSLDAFSDDASDRGRRRPTGAGNDCHRLPSAIFLVFVIHCYAEL